MSPEDFLSIYSNALDLFHQKHHEQAWEMITGFTQATGIRALLGELLKAYILRAQKKYVSEIAQLKELLNEFRDSDDRKRLADACSLLGEAYRMLGDSESAVSAFVESARLEPLPHKKLTELSNAIFAVNASEDLSAERMQTLYAAYRHELAAMHITPYPLPSWKHRKIRVGYMSADLRQHAVGQFVRPFFLEFDQAGFEVYVYQLNAAEDEVTADLRRAPVQWRKLAGADFAAIAAAIRADEIDILLELGGHTAYNALPVLVYRPARVQLSGIGYFNSTGMAECDGFLSDRYCAPQVESCYFTERLLSLPHTHFCYQPYTDFPSVSQPPFCQKQYVTFGSFNNFAKVNDSMLRLWREILARVPDSRLLLKHQLLGTEEGRAYTVERLEALAMPLERIEMRGYSAEYLQEYGDMDIALDTSPYPGGLTTCEALYMGVPVVTLAGNRHGARFGVSFLNNVGLGELVAGSCEDYVNIAAALAGDRELLMVLRQNLRRMMRSSPLMDAKAYMEDVEKLYLQLYGFTAEKKKASPERGGGPPKAVEGL